MSDEIRVLVIDDHPQILNAFRRALDHAGYAVTTGDDCPAAVAALRDGMFDVVLTDFDLPSGTGLDVLEAVRHVDPTIPVLIVTGLGDLAIAQRAIEHGALRFLVKPVSSEQLLAAIDEAYRARTIAVGGVDRRPSARLRALDGDLAQLKLAIAFDEALDHLWMALQPVVSMGRHEVVAYEALLRSDHPTLARPDLLIAAAEHLHRVHELGRRVRAVAAERLSEGAPEVDLLVNLHPSDLSDPDLYDRGAPLSRWAPRVILEITERASLTEIADVHECLERLRALGFRIAVDDLGAGYGSLSAMALIRPDLVKIDMSLVRDVDSDPVRLRMIQSIGSMCAQLGTPWLCEGVETHAELQALAASGADLVQGYLLGRPERELATLPQTLLDTFPRPAPRRRPSQRIALAEMARVVCDQAIAVASASPSIPVELNGLLDTLRDVLVEAAG